MMVPIFLILLVTAVIFAGIFNSLIRYRNLTHEAKSGIDVQLKRRHDLIPKIVEVVKGYAGYESNLLTHVTDLRTQLSAPQNSSNAHILENDLSATMRQLFAVAESYPELKANQNFSQLQKTISEIEDQVQLARRYYNGTVRNYNTAVQSFPAMLVARLFNFSCAEFFQIEYATERLVPDITL
ncbi:MAG: LemA family protein [Candidatus Omnitrophica bacterium]|nr:LemA family protein [Candidatus Omnitrophota bacterium]